MDLHLESGGVSREPRCLAHIRRSDNSVSKQRKPSSTQTACVALRIVPVAEGGYRFEVVRSDRMRDVHDLRDLFDVQFVAIDQAVVRCHTDRGYLGSEILRSRMTEIDLVSGSYTLTAVAAGTEGGAVIFFHRALR